MDPGAAGVLSGKHTQNYGKSPFSMGKLTISMGKHTKNYGTSPLLMGNLMISMAIFNSNVTDCHKVYAIAIHPISTRVAPPILT